MVPRNILCGGGKRSHECFYELAESIFENILLLNWEHEIVVNKPHVYSYNARNEAKIDAVSQ